MKIQPINQNITSRINSEMPKFVQYLNGFRKRMGERQDIVINAVGTGIVAPIFIKYNNFSDADSDTKTYSALRQTAMAVIAVVTQAGITIPLDKYLDKLIKRGALGDKFTPSNPANVTAFKRVTNLMIAFAMIPASCWILNKTYPLIMDKLSNKKEGKNV